MTPNPNERPTYLTLDKFNINLGDDTMNKLDKILSKTEKKKSHIVPIRESNVKKGYIGTGTRGVLYAINQMIKYSFKGNKKIVRIILESNNIVKLMSYDNGTPIIYVFDENHSEIKDLSSILEFFCIKHDLIYSEIC